jgi:ERF superfamily protein
MTGEKKLTVVEALSLVMSEVQAIRKDGRNTSQNFNFRGIDAVVNAVGPALRKHGVVAVPTTVTPHFEQYETKGGTAMRNTTLTVSWRFYGPFGDYVEAQTMGEASDAGDKSVAKAHSVAYRTLLLQALCIPTDDPDPDSETHQRATAPPADPRAALRAEIKHAGEAKGLSVQEIADDFAGWSEGITIQEAEADLLTKYVHHLRTAVTP